MAIEDLQAFLITGFIAAVIALPVAALGRRSRSPYHVTSVWSFGIAIFGGPVAFGIAKAFDQAIAAGGIPFGRAVNVIFSVAFVYSFGAPLFFGLPAILAGCAFQWLLASKRSKLSRGKRPSNDQPSSTLPKTAPWLPPLFNDCSNGVLLRGWIKQLVSLVQADPRV